MGLTLMVAQELVLPTTFLFRALLFRLLSLVLHATTPMRAAQEELDTTTLALSKGQLASLLARLAGQA